MQNFDLIKLLDLIPLNIYWKDKSGLYLGCNLNQAQDFGYNSPSEIIGKTDIELLGHQEMVKSWMQNDQKIMQTGMPLIAEEAGIFNHQKITKLSCKIPFKDDSGNIAGIMGISIDITAQKTVEEKLFQQKESSKIALENIIARLPGHVYWMDNDNRYLGCNDLHATSAGFKSRNEIIGKTNEDTAWSDQKDSLNAINEKVKNTNKEFCDEETAQLSDGTTRVFLSRKTPLLDEYKNVVGILGISFDITDKKNMETALIESKNAAEAANRAKTEFLANMSHDVKSPMTGIVTFTQLMMLDPEWRTPEKAEQVHASAEQVLKFFDSCLELSKLEMAELNSKQVVFSLSALLEEIHALFVPRAQSKGLKFHIHYDAHLPKAFLGHRGSLYRVVLNLIGNAVKFTDKGEVNVRAFIAEHLNDNKIRVGIEVKDTGPGIPEDKHQAIFEKLHRLTPSYEGKIEGSGIGLYIVDQYVKHMQGEINIASTIGQGSAFTVFLPLMAASEADLPAAQRSKANTSTPQVAPSITQRVASNPAPVTQNTLSADAPLLLLVEDNPMIQLATQALLNKAGFRVDIAGTGAAALEAFLHEKYAFIYMDIGLPDIQGYEVAAAIRQKEKELNTTTMIPIIALTAHGSIDVQTFCSHSGMQGILSKPLSPHQAEKVWERFGKGEAIEVPGLILIDAYAAPTVAQATSKKSNNTIPVIDFAETVALIGSDAQANKIFAALAKDLIENYLPQLARTVQQQDYAELRKHLHSLIGALCYAKAPRLQNALLELQQAARNASPTITTAYKHAQAEAEQFFVYYQQMIKGI